MKRHISDIEKAKLLIKKNRIKRVNNPINMNYFIVKGNHDKYVVMLPNYCSCEHFIFRCIKNSDSVCYHILAAKLMQNPELTDESPVNLILK